MKVHSCYNCYFRERRDKDHFDCIVGNGSIHIDDAFLPVDCDDYTDDSF